VVRAWQSLLGGGLMHVPVLMRFVAFALLLSLVFLCGCGADEEQAPQEPVVPLPESMASFLELQREAAGAACVTQQELAAELGKALLQQEYSLSFTISVFTEHETFAGFSLGEGCARYWMEDEQFIRDCGFGQKHSVIFGSTGAGGFAILPRIRCPNDDFLRPLRKGDRVKVRYYLADIFLDSSSFVVTGIAIDIRKL
jgi:hypothetical protein